MSISKPFFLGLLLIVVFVFLSESIILVDDDLYKKLGIDRDSILLFVWLLPVSSAFIAIYFSTSFGVVACICYIFFLTIFLPLTHFVISRFGVNVDFGGVSGMKAMFKIFFFFSTIAITAGAAIGFMVKNIVK